MTSSPIAVPSDGIGTYAGSDETNALSGSAFSKSPGWGSVGTYSLLFYIPYRCEPPLPSSTRMFFTCEELGTARSMSQCSDGSGWALRITISRRADIRRLHYTFDLRCLTKDAPADLVAAAADARERVKSLSKKASGQHHMESGGGTHSCSSRSTSEYSDYEYDDGYVFGVDDDDDGGGCDFITGLDNGNGSIRNNIGFDDGYDECVVADEFVTDDRDKEEDVEWYVIRREREAYGSRVSCHEIVLESLPKDRTTIEIRNRWVVGDHPEDSFLQTAPFTTVFSGRSPQSVTNRSRSGSSTPQNGWFSTPATSGSASVGNTITTCANTASLAAALASPAISSSTPLFSGGMTSPLITTAHSPVPYQKPVSTLTCVPPTQQVSQSLTGPNSYNDQSWSDDVPSSLDIDDEVKLQRPSPSQATISAIPETPERTFLVNFRVKCTFVPPGKEVRLVGGLLCLGKWNVQDAIPMKPSDYPEWRVTVNLAECLREGIDPFQPNFSFEYKYVIAPSSQPPSPKLPFGVTPRTNSTGSPESGVSSPGIPGEVDSFMPTSAFQTPSSTPMPTAATSSSTTAAAKAQEVIWEGSNNRVFRRIDLSCVMPPTEESKSIVKAICMFGSNPRPDDIYVVVEDFPFNMAYWRGVAISVDLATLRTANDMGVGDFNDIKELVDFASRAGVSVIQLTPIFDTCLPARSQEDISSPGKAALLDPQQQEKQKNQQQGGIKRSTQSSPIADPNAPISLFALNPAFMRIEGLTSDPVILQKARNVQQRLNQMNTIDLSQVLVNKFDLLSSIYKQEKETLANNSQYVTFIGQNHEWLEDYAMMKQHAFNEAYGTEYDIGLFVYSQFVLHSQLQSASEYAAKNKVSMSVEIPAFVHPDCIDAKKYPEYFYQKLTVGEPPGYGNRSVLGINRRLLIPNWNTQKERGYKLWCERFEHLSRYFQSVCLREISSYFRVWAVPDHASCGRRGHFIPHRAPTCAELERRGLSECRSYAFPYITDRVVMQEFGADNADRAIRELLTPIPGTNRYQIRKDIYASMDAAAHGTALEPGQKPVPEWARNSLNRLRENTLLTIVDEMRGMGAEAMHVVPVPHMEEISLGAMDSMDRQTRQLLISLQDEYYYGRDNNMIWKESGMENLKNLSTMTSMFIFGEDVPELPQWATTGMSEAGVPMVSPVWSFSAWLNDTPYWSLSASSSISRSLLRCWWEENRNTPRARQFYNDVLKIGGELPHFCETYLVQSAVLKCLESPSILAIFPLPDLLALRPEFIAGKDPHEEGLGPWIYRMQMPLEALKNNHSFTQLLRGLIRNNNRLPPV